MARGGSPNRSVGIAPLIALGLVALLVASCRPASPVAKPAPVDSKRTVVVPASIDPTGRTDVTWPLREFFASTPNDTSIIFPAGARYRVEGTIRLFQRRGLVFEGNGATIFATTQGEYDRSHWRFVRGSNIVVRNLTVRGAHPDGGTADDAYVPALEAQHGFRFEGTQGAELDRVRVTDVYGDFVYVGRDSDTRTWSERIWVHDSSFARNGRQGIAVTAGRDVTIERNEIRDVRRATIDLEPNTRSWGAVGIRVLDNRIGKGRLYFVASHGVGPVNDVVIARNRLDGHVLNVEVKAPEGQRRSNWTVTDNTSNVESHQRAMRFIGTDNVTVLRNTQRISRASEPGVVLWDVCGFDVRANDFGAGGEPKIIDQAC